VSHRLLTFISTNRPDTFISNVFTCFGETKNQRQCRLTKAHTTTFLARTGTTLPTDKEWQTVTAPPQAHSRGRLTYKDPEIRVQRSSAFSWVTVPWVRRA